MNFIEAKRRVYEIYEIPEEVRQAYSIHHIIFKRDIKFNPVSWQGFRVNDLANLCPLKIKEHRELHLRVDRQEGYHGTIKRRRRNKKHKSR